MRILYTLIILSCSLTLSAQEVEFLTLEDAISYGLQNSLEVKNAQINIADAEQEIVETRAIGIPQVNLGVDYNYFLELPVSLVPAIFFDPTQTEGFAELTFGTKNSLTASLDATALLFDGSYFVGLKAAKESRNYANDQLVQTQSELKQRIRAAYYPALIIQTNINTIEKNLDNLGKLLAETKQLNEAGFAEQLDVDRLELSLANLQTEKENLERQTELAYNALKFHMGYPLDQPIQAADKIESLLEEVAAEDLIAKIDFGQRADYRTMETVIQLNNLNVDLQKAAYLPSVAAFGSYQYIGQGDNLFKDAFWNPTAVVGLQLNVPVFSGLMRNAKVSRAELQLETYQNQQKQLERAIMLEVNNARSSYRNAQQRVESQKKNVALAQRIYNTAQIKYKEGVGSSLEINQAESSLFQTQSNYTQALYDLLTAKSNLDKALGR